MRLLEGAFYHVSDEGAMLFATLGERAGGNGSGWNGWRWRWQAFRSWPLFAAGFILERVKIDAVRLGNVF